MAYRSRSRYYEARWPEYVPVAERRRRAALEMEKLRKKGQSVCPVTLAGKKIATTFWGKAWCDNLERYADFSNRIGRGRTYVRNGSVVDLQIAPRTVTAIVSGSSLYKIKIDITGLPKSEWSTICRDCAGGIDSLVELLQGRFSTGVMERICREADGLFPKPAEIQFKCSCPDWAYMCKHVAAVLYGVGARLDQQPELLFRLRAVDEKELLARIDTPLTLAKAGSAGGKVLEEDNLAALFGLDIDGAEVNTGKAEPTTPRVRAAPVTRKGVKTRSKQRPTRAGSSVPNKAVAGAKRAPAISPAKSSGKARPSAATPVRKPEPATASQSGATAKPRAARRGVASKRGSAAR